MSWELNRTKQCKTCPWRKGATVENIPNYQVGLHKKLEGTIAKDVSFGLGDDLKVMACHNSTEQANQHCIGWLNNQLGAGNNIPLRLDMLSCSNGNEIEVMGDQKNTFEETFC